MAVAVVVAAAGAGARLLLLCGWVGGGRMSVESTGPTDPSVWERGRHSLSSLGRGLFIVPA